jgi:hypothetical protein
MKEMTATIVTKETIEMPAEESSIRSGISRQRQEVWISFVVIDV